MAMPGYEYLIVGGGIAGQRACEGIRQVDGQGSIALVTQELHLPYQRPPLSKGYLLGKEGLDKVYLKDETFYAQNGIEIMGGVQASGIDPAARSVSLDDGRVLTYGSLLLATGSQARRLPIPGNDLPGVFTLRTIDDANAILAAVGKRKRALVVGGSFIGCEVASALTQLGVGVTMVFPEARLLELVVPVELSTALHARYEGEGVHILPGHTPERLMGHEQVDHAILRDKGSHLVEVDLVVMGVGVRLNTRLAGKAGLQMDEKGAVIVDETLRTSDPHIYAAGDIAAWPDATFGKRLRVEHWDVARQQGRRAGENMAGAQKPYTALPYFYSDLFDLSFEVWGDLSAWDQTVLRGSLDSNRFVLHYFHQGRMVGVLMAGRPAEERKPLQALVKARPAYADVADRLRDESVDLRTLVE